MANEDLFRLAAPLGHWHCNVANVALLNWINEELSGYNVAECRAKGTLTNHLLVEIHVDLGVACTHLKVWVGLRRANLIYVEDDQLTG